VSFKNKQKGKSMIAAMSSSQIIGIVGGLLGAAVGIAGAVVGVYFGIKNQKKTQIH
jgi:hypothetical protein